MEKNGATSRICLKCSQEVTGDNDYCSRCMDEMHKTASESAPSTLREAVDSVADKFNVDKDWEFSR